MFCQGCGNQLNDGAQFCNKCGRRTGNQMVSPGAAAQQNAYSANPAAQQNGYSANPAAQQNGYSANPTAQQNVYSVNPAAQQNAYSVNPAVNVNGDQPKKKKHTLPIVISIIAAVMALGIGGGAWFVLRSSDDVETGGSASSEMEEDESRDRDEKDSTQASIEEVIEYVDQAEELLVNAFEDAAALSEGEVYGSEEMKEQVAILEKALSDLADLKKDADGVKGLDAVFENAKTEYFSMANDSLKAYSDVMGFLADFIDLAYVMDDRPMGDDYYPEDYYYVLYDWYVDAKEGYDAITSCPPCLESEWKQLGEVLDLNYDIAYKIYTACENEDYLRLFSALNLSDRYEIVTERQVDELLNGIMDGEANFLSEQLDLSVRLAEEMRDYAELDEEERSDYEFEYARAGEIKLDYDAVDVIYPSLYNTYDAFLIVKTGCFSGTKTIVVEAEIPGFTQDYKESITLDSSYRTIYIKPPALTGSLDLTSAKDAQIKVSISEQDGTLIEAKTFPVTIKSKYDVEWITDEYGVSTQDNILCFLTPDSAAISDLKRQAIDEISNMTGGQVESFAGYQGSQWNHYVLTYLQAAGIMRAMYENGVRYNMDPFSISGSQQHILFPSDVLDRQSGLCIETSLVVASALQSAGMHAFLVLPPGHAQVAVEVWNAGEGAGEYFLIETTALSSDWNNQNVFVDDANALIGYEALNSSPIAYYDQDEWYDYLSVPGTYIIDCDDSRVLGLTPFAN